MFTPPTPCLCDRVYNAARAQTFGLIEVGYFVGRNLFRRGEIVQVRRVLGYCMGVRWDVARDGNSVQVVYVDHIYAIDSKKVLAFALSLLVFLLAFFRLRRVHIMFISTCNKFKCKSFLVLNKNACTALYRNCIKKAAVQKTSGTGKMSTYLCTTGKMFVQKAIRVYGGLPSGTPSTTRRYSFPLIRRPLPHKQC
jgi:hypothetical protein